MRTRSVISAILLTALLGMSPVRTFGADQPPYEINVVLGLSGPSAFLGEAQQRSLKALEEVVNKAGGIRGRPVRFTFYDDQTNPQISVELASQLISKKVPLFLGSVLVATCSAVAPLSENAQVVQYCFSPGIHPTSGSHVFSSSFSLFDEIVTFLKYFRERGWTRIAFLSTTDATGQEAVRDFDEALALPENKGMNRVTNEHFNPSDVTVSAQVARIQAAKPDIIVVWAPGTPFGTALRALRDVGLDTIPVATSGANMTLAQMHQYGGFIPDSLYFSATGYLAGISDNAAQARVIQTFTDAMKQQSIGIDYQAGMAWDPAMIVIDALRALGPNASAMQIRDWIANLRNYVGLSGIYDFRRTAQRGLSQRDVVILRWKNSETRWIAASKPGGDLP